MQKPEIHMHCLHERLDSLERQNRSLKLILGATVLVVASLGLLGVTEQHRVVEAERFILRDSQGRVRITIGTPRSSGATVGLQSDDPVIWITDEKGQDRALLTMDNLRFADEKEKPLWSAR
jgi:hypothetical protein